MPCFHPLKAGRTSSGAIKILCAAKNYKYIPSDGARFSELLDLPCGQCVGCRLAHSKGWAVRCMHEAQMYDNNCFITLTYAPEHLPVINGQPTLVLDHYQKFMKRLRFLAKGLTPIVNPYPSSDDICDYPVTWVHWPIRFFHAGEYGEKNGRPHYHACIFNYDFPDKVKLPRKSPSGMTLYRSAFLEEIWPYGFSSIGTVTFQSAAYVARYIMKKQNGPLSSRAYAAPCPETGEILYRSKEYTTMSRRPGIGSLWFDEYSSDVYPHDYVIVNGRKCRPPKFYDGRLKAVAPDLFEEIRDERAIKLKNNLDNSTPDRLAAREEVQQAQLRRLPRNLQT
jgi:hypothetical protein